MGLRDRTPDYSKALDGRARRLHYKPFCLPTHPIYRQSSPWSCISIFAHTVLHTHTGCIRCRSSNQVEKAKLSAQTVRMRAATPPPPPPRPRVLGPSPAHAVGKTRVLGGHRPSCVRARVARRSAALQLVLVGAILVEVVVVGGHGALLDLAEAARARASRLHERLIRRACTRARQEGKGQKAQSQPGELGPT